MLNFIRADLYKTFHRKYTYWFLGLTSLGVLLITFFSLFAQMKGMLNGVNGFEFAYMGAMLMIISLGVPVYLLLIVVDVVHSEEYKHQTMKNTVSYGIPRSTIYFGRLISSLLVGLLTLAVLVAVLVVSTFLTFRTFDAASFKLVGDYVQLLLMALPLYVGCLGVGVCLAFVLKSGTAFAFAYLGVLNALPPVFEQLDHLSPIFGKIYNWMLTPQFASLGNDPTWSQIGKYCIIGFATLAISTVIGFALFRRKEIK